MKTYYRRNLPHYQPKDAVLFVTTRLHGSLPKEKLKALKHFKQKEQLRLDNLNVSEEILDKEWLQSYEVYFKKFDDALHQESNDIHWFKDDRISQIWLDALLYFDNQRYKVICSTIMSNHVHFILYKLDRSLFKIMKSIKGYSARQANKVLMTTIPNRKKGASFWQEESYDRCIRDRKELQLKIRYVLNNPVKAGLVKHWKDWKWNYIHSDFLKFM